MGLTLGTGARGSPGLGPTLRQQSGVHWSKPTLWESFADIAPPFCPLALYPPLGSCGLALSDSSPAPRLWGLGCRGAGEAKVLWERAHPSGTAAHTEWALNRLSEGTPWWSPHSYGTVSVPVLLHSLCVPCLGHPQLSHMPLHFLLRCSVQFSSVQLLSCV